MTAELGLKIVAGQLSLIANALAFACAAIAGISLRGVPRLLALGAILLLIAQAPAVMFFYDWARQHPATFALLGQLPNIAAWAMIAAAFALLPRGSNSSAPR